MQTYTSRILLDPAPPGGGGGGGTFNPATPEGFTTLLQALPDDMRTDPNFANIKTFPDLAKSFVNAQKLIGTKRTALPDANWTPQQYDEFYKTLGRPEKPDLYKPSDAVKPREGIALDENRLKVVRENFHKMGITEAQGRQLLDMYVGDLNHSHESIAAAREEATKKAELDLKQQWGDKFDQNIDIARSVLKQFDKDGVVKQILDTSGLGNDPRIVGFFHEIGRLMVEDSSRGKGGGLKVQDATRAAQEINTLRGDPEFQKALFQREHPGHQAAVDKWTLLHEQAFPADKK